MHPPPARGRGVGQDRRAAPVAPPSRPPVQPPPGRADARRTLLAAALLALGAAVSLGLARFSYALLLPPMRADLDWRYITAGAMNTANAAGYLLGALAMPALLRRWPATRALWLGSAVAALLLVGHGLTRSEPVLYALRLAVGVASAVVFVAGGLLAARLGTRPALGPGITPGLVLGLYYGGTGLGIVACAALLPPLLARAALGDAATGLGGGLFYGLFYGLSGWQIGWLALGLLAALATVALGRVQDTPQPPQQLQQPATGPAPAVKAAATGAAGPASTAAPAATAHAPAAPGALWRPFAPALAGYGMFGLGYIGYMTFIVTLLREQGLGSGAVAAFYALLGLGVMASPWLWAGLLQRHRHGRPLASLNALLALATLLPVLPAIGAHPVTVFTSGALFGGVFLSVVASTTALVRHNLPAAQWPAGISAFTVVFAAGQIVGPSLVGWLSDGPGGLRLGLAVSAAALAVGAVLASRQKALG